MNDDTTTTDDDDAIMFLADPIRERQGRWGNKRDGRSKIPSHSVAAKISQPRQLNAIPSNVEKGGTSEE